MTELFNEKDRTELRKTLRNTIPESEVIVWSRLQRNRLGGYKFRRQASIGPYVVDFYCPREKLVVEIDGDSHFTGEAEVYDWDRTTYFESLGLRVVRFTNEDVRRRLPDVLEDILLALKTTPSPPEGGANPH